MRRSSVIGPRNRSGRDAESRGTLLPQPPPHRSRRGRPRPLMGERRGGRVFCLPFSFGKQVRYVNLELALQVRSSPFLPFLSLLSPSLPPSLSCSFPSFFPPSIPPFLSLFPSPQPSHPHSLSIFFPPSSLSPFLLLYLFSLTDAHRPHSLSECVWLSLQHIQQTYHIINRPHNEKHSQYFCRGKEP